MSCAICGKPTLIGARLCTPCRAALKRAKDNTVFELPPGAASPAPRTSAATAVAPASASVTALARRASRGRLVRVAGVGFLCVAAFGATALHLVARDRPEVSDRQAVTAEGGAAGSVDDSTLVRRATATAAMPVPAGAPSSPGVAPARIAAAAGGLPVVAGEPLIVHAPDPDAAQAGAHRARARTGLAPLDAQPLPATPAPVAPPRVILAAAIEARAAPANPWQALDDALARCAAESFFARIGCEHRARATHCEGRWGEPTHCPSGIPTDRGQ